MNLKINYIKLDKLIALLIAFITISSCTEDLNQFPPDRISDASFWKTPEDFQLAANNLYPLIIPSRRSNDADSDIQRHLSTNEVSQGRNTVPDGSGFFNSSFEYIRAINKILEQEVANPDVDASRFTAEARFFRAWVYYNLVSVFGDMPIVTKVLSTGSEELKNTPRSPITEVLGFAINDLQEAIPNLPVRSSMAANELGRVTKGAAQTLLAKIALFDGTWSKYNNTGGDAAARFQLAVDAARAVINSDEYALYNAQGSDSYRQFFWNPDADDESIGVKPEKILSRRYFQDIAQHNSSTNNQGFSATKKIIDLYLCTDGLPIDISPLFQGYDTYTSEFENRDLRMIQSIVKDGDVVWTNNGANNVDAELNYDNQNYTGYRMWKQNGDGDDRAAGREVNDLEQFRYAEVLLIFAEAMYELNGSISDADLDISINLLRDRGGIAPLTNALVNTNNLEMLTEIRRERTVELAFEGERLDDLKRWGIAVEEMTKPMKGFQWDNSDWSTTSGLDISNFPNAGTDSEGFLIVEPASEREFSDKNLLFPLPSSELLLTDWQQNPGW